MQGDLADSLDDVERGRQKQNRRSTEMREDRRARPRVVNKNADDDGYPDSLILSTGVISRAGPFKERKLPSKMLAVIDSHHLALPGSVLGLPRQLG